MPTWKDRPAPDLNIEFSVIRSHLNDSNRFGRFGLVGTTEEGGYCYVLISSLQISNDQMQGLVDEVRSRFDCPGMIIDLRGNNGGNELAGKMLASLFCKESVIYAINQFRLNEHHDEFSRFVRSPVQPADGDIYEGPVVCLIGPGAVSSAEGTALMFKALPNVTLIGQPTRGSSGNPAPVALPNGVEVWFSRWVASDAEGVPIEGRGVQPDILVEHVAGSDPTLDRACEELAR